MSKKSQVKVQYEKPIFRFSALLYLVINRYTVITSIVFLMIFHILSETSISKSGAFIGALGLLLSLKHGFIKISSSQDDAVKKSRNTGSVPLWLGICSNQKYQNEAAKQTTDEMIGVLLVIVGGLVSSYGEDISLLFSNYSIDRELIFELVGFTSLLLSFILTLLSNPKVKLVSARADLLPENIKEVQAQEFISTNGKVINT